MGWNMNQLENKVQSLLCEIEDIIGRIGRFDCGSSQLTRKGRQELSQLFREKLAQVQCLNARLKRSG